LFNTYAGYEIALAPLPNAREITWGLVKKKPQHYPVVNVNEED